jgi:BlaI family penicillinase repressor
MEKEVNITEAEWKVMEFLWKNPLSTMSDIRAALEPSGWNSSTIKTLVTRLVQKGAVETDGKTRNSKYFAVVTEEECKTRETRNFLDRIYNGSVKMMVSNLVKDSRLSKSDAEELMNLIDKMED